MIEFSFCELGCTFFAEHPSPITIVERDKIRIVAVSLSDNTLKGFRLNIDTIVSFINLAASNNFAFKFRHETF